MDRDEDRAAAERLRAALEMMAFGFEVMRQNLRRNNPGASEDEVERAFEQWLEDRPGAEFGDCVGKGRPWPPTR